MGKFGKDEFSKSNTWRVYCKNTLEQFDGTTYKVRVINPNDYFNFVEEPPKYTIFIFCTTAPEKIPDTILNRVQRFNLSKLPTQELKNRLL